MSWLKPYLRTWYQAYPESVPPVRQLAHYVKPLQQAHPEARIVQELASYLKRTPAQFISLHRFASAFGSWTEGAKSKLRPAHYQSADEADARAGIPPQNRTVKPPTYTYEPGVRGPTDWLEE